MREMKDSGIEWVGMIPAHWEIIPMKYLIKGYKAGPFGSALITEQLDDEGAILVYTPEHIAAHKAELPSNLYLPEFRRIEMKQFFVQKNDLVFPIVGSLGRSMLITEEMPDGIINQRLAKFSLSSPKIRIEYFLWLFSKSDFYATYMELNSRGAIIQNLTKAIVSAMPVVIPTVCEQQKISSYLDTQCTSLDALSADIQSQIDVLEQYKKSVITEAVTKGLNPEVEMKDSGIEWVGMIPQKWETIPIRYLFSENKQKNVDGKVTTALKFTYGSIVKKDNFDAESDDYVANTILTYTVVHPGMIMVNCLNLNYDFISQRIGLVHDDGIITSAYLSIVPGERVFPQYAAYVLKSWDAAKVFHNMGKGVRKTLSFDELGKCYFALPTLCEQQHIINYLDHKCAEIDAAIAEKKAQLETIAEYKKSMIYEYVTGKKEVPDVG